MKVQMGKEDFSKINCLKNGELVANKYALKSITSAIVMLAIIWVLTIWNVFLVDKKVTTSCFIACAIVYALGMLVCKVNDMSKAWIKYFILLWVVAIITIVSIYLTYHATLACLLPIVYTSMYSSKKMMAYTYILTVCSIIVSVFAGYYFGVCDANMVLLPGQTLNTFIGSDGTFTLDHINDQVVWTLSQFFVLPRCMICAAFTVVCANIKKIINLNVKYAQKMENMAETDGMTGLYNKSKYLDMISDTYKKEERIGVIFWDINYLKKTNDTIGHEAGDKLILTVAQSIKNVTNASDNGYRIGGDEFIMVMCGGDEKSVLRKIQDWEKSLEILQKSVEFPISVSMGYSFGKGEELDNIIYAADQMMYENKRAIHKEIEKK